MINISNYSDKEKIALVALYYASLKSSDLEYKNMKTNFFILSQAYDVKVNTIKNWKDAFDAKFSDNGRLGWHDKELHERDKILANLFEEIIESQKYTSDEIFETVKNIIKEKSNGFINDNTIKVFLLKDNDVQYGLNWGDRIDKKTNKSRNKNEAYLQLTPEVYKSDFFPSRGKYFTVITDDNEKIILNRGQKDDGSALETPENNTILGLYLRKRLGVPENERITKESIVNYGRDYITIRKQSDTEFYLDFSNKYEAEPLNESYNKIFFGAPGTGKSYSLNKLAKPIIQYNNFERVTFHPNYSYGQFVGVYKPVSIITDSNKNDICYKYIPGPFLRIYLKAKLYPQNNYILIIEEINRANVSAVFGDIFQLLDRDSDGESTYPIAISEDMKNYFNSEGLYITTLALPKNLYIWATMNSADQGVFPIDTAFKRRWEFEYIGIDDNEKDLINSKHEPLFIPICKNGVVSQRIKWNDLRKAINNKLISLGINEDKLLGPFFLNKSVLESAMDKGKDFVKLFESKVLMYLFEDAAKMKVKSLFNVDKYMYSEVCKKFEKEGLDVFILNDEDNVFCEDIKSESPSNGELFTNEF